jgi:hypothetical protein
MKHFKSLTAILVMLTLVLASCGGQTPVVNDASSSTDSKLETEALSKDPRYPAPTITITSTAYQNIDLRVETDLAKQFKVTHPIAKKVTLTVTSDKDGVLFNGDWLIDPTLFTPSALKRTFATPGTRTITVTAKAASYTRTGTFYLNVINTAPKIVLHADSNPRIGDEYFVTAQILDKNEPDGKKICANTTWSIDASDAEISNLHDWNPDKSDGCRVKLKFSSAFTYQLRVRTHDSDGIEAVNAVNLTVLPAFIDQGQRFISPRFSLHRIDPCSRGLIEMGEHFDLTVNCLFPQLSTAAFRVNKDPNFYNLVWSMFVTNDQGIETILHDTPTSYSLDNNNFHFDFNFEISRTGGAPVTRDCRLAVRYTYPGDATEYKTLWVGKCTYYTQPLIK